MNLLSKKYNEYNWNFRRVLSKSINSPHFLKQSINIGILDSGLSLDNHSFSTHEISRFSLIDNPKDVTDELDHGTQVMGVLDTLIKNATIKSFKIFKGNTAYSHSIIKGIYAAIDADIDILNISLGSYKNPLNANDKSIIEEFNTAINTATKNNLLIVASSGNHGYNMDKVDFVHMPSDHKDVISVGSTLKNFERATYSNYGSSLNIVAPSGIISYDQTRSKFFFNEMTLTYSNGQSHLNELNKLISLSNSLTLTYGTSVSVPIVTAALAIIIDKNPNYSIDEYKNILYNNAYKLNGQACTHGYGEVRIL